MILSGDFRNNVFTNSPQRCFCKDCKFHNNANLKCENQNSKNYNEFMTAQGTCDTSEKNIEQIWMIVRSLKDLDYRSDIEMLYVPELSPSPELYHKFLEWKKNGQWNKETFLKEYVPEFLEDLHSSESMAALRKIVDESQTKNIMLACYCSDEEMCHRSIVLGVLQGMGAKVAIDKDYLQYYEMFKEINPEFVKHNQRVSSDIDRFYLLVAGSRDYANYGEMKAVLDKCLEKHQALGHEIVIVSGGVNGADSLAERYAQANGYRTIIMEADWKTYGKRAGYLRNEKMHKKIASKPNRGCICFWDGESRGTQHNFKLAEIYHNQIKVLNYKEHRFLTEKEIKAYAMKS